MEEATLLQDIAIIMLAAGAVTLLFRRLHQPPILGYLIAGLLIGPFTLPLIYDNFSAPVHDIDTIRHLADLGLVLLLFGLGLEFSWSKIRQVGTAVLLIGGIEILTMISLGYGLGRALGWEPTEAIFLGAALHISSSAVIVKILRDSGRLEFLSSKLIVGILVVEDFAAVAIIAVLSGIGTTGTTEFGEIGELMLRLVVFIVASLVIGALLVPRIMKFTHRFDSKEAMLVTSLGLCFGMALIGDLLELSAAIGAFLVGAIIADTDHSEEVNDIITPLRDMFAALFFVTIGMLIDLGDFTEFIFPALIVTAVFLLGKTIANTTATFVAGYDGRTALQVGTGMPQMGEFSLAIAKVGVDKAVVSAPLYPIIALVVAITSFTTPYISRSSDSLARFLERKSPRLLKEYESSLADWLATVRGSFSRDSDSARKVQGAFKVILVNLLIMLVLSTAGAFALRSAGDLADTINVPTDVLGFILGFGVLLLCLPCFLVIGRNLRKLAHEATRSMIRRRRSAKRWRQEAMQGVLRDSITVILIVFLALWFIPFISALLSIGDLAIVIPIVILGAIVLLVFRSLSNIHSQVEKTFGRVLIGEDYITTSEAATILGTREKTVEKLVEEEKLPAVKIDGNWCVTRQSIEELSEPDLQDSSENEVDEKEPVDQDPWEEDK